jgi:hypothetical protein
MRYLCYFAFCLASLVLMSMDARAEKRVALIIGNGAYKNVQALTNPTNDATDVAASLKRSGFELLFETNLDQAGMQDAIIRFARAARDADVALFYYSGHALQFAGVNYLMPVDAVLRDEVDLRRMARADEILADLQQAKNLRILVLDACRDNPFADELRRTIGQGRSVNLGRGLAKMESPEGTIISYATQAGRTADDGDAHNSPYTAAFLQHILDRDNITSVFQTISATVYERTKGTQVPELSLSYFGQFYLNGKPDAVLPVPSAALQADPCANAADHWHSAEMTGTLVAFKDHVLRFPKCAFADLANARIEQLSKPSETAAPANPFDGIWLVREDCENNPPWPAATLQYPLRIKGGKVHNQFGDEGKPGSSIFDGHVEADGSANLTVNGFIDTEKDPLHRPSGAPFHYVMLLELKGSNGVGYRSETSRPCRSQLSRLSSVLPPVPTANEKPDANSSGSSPDPKKGGKPNDADLVTTPDQRERALQQGQSGLSCSTMRGRCAAVCVANTGRADCASTVCVRLEGECLSTGCWRGRSFSGCGLAKR